MEGKLDGRKNEEWTQAKKASAIKRPDNLKPEGSFNLQASMRLK